MLIVIGEAEAAPGRLDQMVQAVGAMASATATEDGCLSYGFYADVTRPHVILGLEVWRDQASLDAHLSHSHTQEFLAAMPDLVAGAPSMRSFHAEPTQGGIR